MAKPDYKYNELCKDMEYNPFSTGKSIHLRQKYPALSRRPGFNIPKVTLSLDDTDDTTDDVYHLWDENEADMLLRFVILFVDPQSPLAEETDFHIRMDQAMKWLNIKGDNELEEEIVNQKTFFRTCVFEYFTMVNRPQYEFWFSLKMNVHHMNQFLRTPPDTNNLTQDINARRQLSKDLEEIMQELNTAQYALFKDERLAKLINNHAGESVLGYAEEFAEDPEWKEQLR